VLREIYGYKSKINDLRLFSTKAINQSLKVESYLLDVNMKAMYWYPIDFISVNNFVNENSKDLLIQLTRVHEYCGTLSDGVEKSLAELCKYSKHGITSDEAPALIASIRAFNKSLMKQEG